MGGIRIPRFAEVCLAVGTLLVAAPAAAEPSDDYQTCARASGDVAIAACTRAITSGAFKSHDQAVLYYNLGVEYGAKGDKDRAIADYNEAIRLDSKYAAAYSNRGNAYGAKGDKDRAIADYSEAIRLVPKYAKAFFGRGHLYLYGGSIAKAQADFKQASELNPKYAYHALWLDIAERRNNIPSHLAQTAKPLDMTAWPAPVVRLFLGEMTPAAVLAAADDANPKTRWGQMCEANFFSGEFSLLQNAKEEAARLFRVAASDCPKDFIEWDAANAELKVLGAVR